MAMLELYLIRHGIAAERGEEWPDDSKRPLTSQGIAKLKKEARGLVALDVSFEQIVSSPLVRTRQTADVIAEVLKNKPPISTSDALAPAGTPAAVIEEIAKHVRKARVALVGHEPNLGELAAQLIRSRTPHPALRHQFLPDRPPGILRRVRVVLMSLRVAVTDVLVELDERRFVAHVRRVGDFERVAKLVADERDELHAPERRKDLDP